MPDIDCAVLLAGMSVAVALPKTNVVVVATFATVVSAAGEFVTTRAVALFTVIQTNIGQRTIRDSVNDKDLYL